MSIVTIDIDKEIWFSEGGMRGVTLVVPSVLLLGKQLSIFLNYSTSFNPTYCPLYKDWVEGEKTKGVFGKEKWVEGEK